MAGQSCKIKTATGGCTVAVVIYIAYKLTISRRTTRIKTVITNSEYFVMELHDVHHQTCASFLKKLLTIKV